MKNYQMVLKQNSSMENCCVISFYDIKISSSKILTLVNGITKLVRRIIKLVGILMKLVSTSNINTSKLVNKNIYKISEYINKISEYN